MTEMIQINIQRIEYMMKIYSFQKRADLLSLINKNSKRKSPLIEEDIFTNEIKISYLKNIDEIFNKGLSFYTDPSDIDSDKQASILFRKDQLNADLELGDRERIHKIECDISYLSGLSKLADFDIKRTLPTFTLDHSTQKVALQIRDSLYPKTRISNDRDFLKALITIFAENNILVHEFVETWNKKLKTNCNGFFIAPHHIVIKRQRSFKREIFTLVHELAHYLLAREEIDSIQFEPERINTVERWCDAFAYYFLVGDHAKQLQDIFQKKPNYDNQYIKEFSNKLHVSRLAIFTNFAVDEIIDWKEYADLKQALDDDYREAAASKNEEAARAKERLKAIGEEPIVMSPKPINSPLEKEIYRHAYFEGVIEEHDIIGRFKPSSKDIDDFLYGNEHG